MICTSEKELLGTGRAYLPLECARAQNLAYGQPVVVQCTVNESQRRFLCTASVAAANITSQIAFDPSVQLGLEITPAAEIAHQPLEGLVRPVIGKVVAAASLKVVIPDQLLGSPVPAARLQQRLVQKNCTLHLSSSTLCQVVDITPAAAAATVYRVVPSTSIHLVTRSNKDRNSAGAEPAGGPASAAAQVTALSATAAPTAADGQAHGTPARPNSSSGSQAPTNTTPASRSRPSSSQGSRAPSAGNSSSSSSKSGSTKAKKKSSPASSNKSKSSAAAAITPSNSMFDVLDSLGDE